MATLDRGIQVPDLLSKLVKGHPAWMPEFLSTVPDGLVSGDVYRSPTVHINAVRNPVLRAYYGKYAPGNEGLSATADDSTTANIWHLSHAPEQIRWMSDNWANYQLLAKKVEASMRSFRQGIGRSIAWGITPKVSTSNFQLKAGRFARATGGNTREDILHGSTPAVKAVQRGDILGMARRFQNECFTMDGATMLIPASIFQSLYTADAELRQAYAYGSATIPSGTVPKIFGFNVYIVPDTYLFAERSGSGNGTTYTLEPPENQLSPNNTRTATANSRPITLFYLSSYVTKSVGAPKFHMQGQDSRAFGSSYSAEIASVASPALDSGVGVFAMVHDNQ